MEEKQTENVQEQSAGGPNFKLGCAINPQNEGKPNPCVSPMNKQRKKDSEKEVFQGRKGATLVFFQFLELELRKFLISNSYYIHLGLFNIFYDNYYYNQMIQKTISVILLYAF